jgi:hypothetical protein
MKHQTIAIGFAVSTSLILSACGGGSDSSSKSAAATSNSGQLTNTIDTPVNQPVVNMPPPASLPTTLSGVVAVGAALSGASIVIKDVDATTPDVTVIADAEGSFNADVSTLKAPLFLSASAILNGERVTLVSLVTAVTDKTRNISNITSLTNAIASLVAPSGDVTALNSSTTLATAATSTNVNAATLLVVNTLKTDPAIAAVLGTNFQPLTTIFKADGTGIDAVLHQLEVIASSSGVSITNLAAPIDASDSATKPQTGVVLTANTTTAPSLPGTAPSGTVPSVIELNTIAKKFEACYALPISQRVSQNTAGEVTAVAATCNFAASDWKSDGYNWLQNFAQGTLTRDIVTSAKAGVPTIVLTTLAANRTGATDFKHPYCNAATCVTMRLPITTTSGKASLSDWTLAKVAGVWTLVGNQLPYAVGVQPRLYQYKSLNATLASANPTTYYLQDRYQSVLRLGFDVSTPGAELVRAVRWTGPGLPAAGVVSARSQDCTTDDRMAIVYQNGSTTIFNSNPVTKYSWTRSSGTEFILDAAKLDGTRLTLPQPVLSTTTTNGVTSVVSNNQNISPVTLAAQIEAWVQYKAEIFLFSNSSATVPDQIIYTRTVAPTEPASAGMGKSWPTLNGNYIDNYLKPTGTSAGLITTPTQPISWTNPSDGYVSAAYLFSSNSLTTLNSENETDNYEKRSRLDYRLGQYGDSSVSIGEFASARSGVATSSQTASNSVNPNPRCSDTNLVPLLTTDTSSYRETGLQFRGGDRKIYQAVWFWDFN